MPDIVLLVDLTTAVARVVLGAVFLLAAGLFVFDRRTSAVDPARGAEREERPAA